MAGNVNKKSRRKSAHEEAPFLPFNSDDCPMPMPAAGYRNGTSVNNVGDNGNYWSATQNESNSNNAYNLNFNSNGNNWNNNWNRNNGHTVRPVSELTDKFPSSFKLTPEQLLTDLFRAYKDARRHKRKRFYQQHFEMNMEEELVRLRNELYSRTYKPEPSMCFVITDPKHREVFAASFRDRIVHHLYYNYTYELFERTFVFDSYSCRKGKGTHFGVKRLEHHVRRVSSNFQKQCYVMKLDIKGYFMHINRERLLDICLRTLKNMQYGRTDEKGKQLRECLDFDFLSYLSEVIIMNDPTKDCMIKGSACDWRNLPKSKSLFHSPEGCGLPIGNLTSQLFSNVYLNVLDQMIKRTLHCKAYGRYVDDFFIVADNKAELRQMIGVINNYLQLKLGLDVHPDKIIISDARHGISFLGAFVKPYRRYISNKTLCRMRGKIQRQIKDKDVNEASINSYLGVLSHYSSFNIRKVLFDEYFFQYGYFGRGMLKYVRK